MTSIARKRRLANEKAEHVARVNKALQDNQMRSIQNTVDQAIAATTTTEALFGQAGRNVEKLGFARYHGTEKLGAIDLQHVVSASVGPPGSPTVIGLFVEISQLRTDYMYDQNSAFKTADLVSNVLGGVARDNAARYGTSVGQEVAYILHNADYKGLRSSDE